jgi:hypothetical protein
LANKVGMLAKNYELGRCAQRRGLRQRLKNWAGFRGVDRARRYEVWLRFGVGMR